MPSEAVTTNRRTDINNDNTANSDGNNNKAICDITNITNDNNANNDKKLDTSQNPPNLHDNTTTTASRENNVSRKVRPQQARHSLQADSPPPPDGGWGWMVVLSSFVVSVLVDGVCFSAGIFFNPFRDYFHASKAQTAWVGSVLNGSYMIVGPLVSACTNRWGCRRVAMLGSLFAGISFFLSTFSTTLPVLIVTYGMLGGIGFGFVYLPANIMPAYYFAKKRALATGIACCGSGVGAFIFAPLCNFLLEEYGWKGATWILSGLVLNGLVFSMLYRPLKQRKRCDHNLEEAKVEKEETGGGGDGGGGEEGARESAAQSKGGVSGPGRRSRLRQMVVRPLLAVVDVSLLKSPTFVIYGLSCILSMLGFFVPFVYLPPLSEDLGVSTTKASFLISIIGIANTVSRVGAGFVADRPWADCLLINNVALIVGGVATCCVPFLTEYSLLATYALIFGSSIAIFVSLRSIIMVELMGLKRLTNAFGLVVMCQGISSFVGAPIAGMLSDATGDYNISFYAAGSCLALGGAICLPLRRISSWESRRNRLGPEE